jgi:transaldolase/glucose-6-phosphate isomerase
VLRHTLHDPLDLGEEFFLWEFATAVAGSLLGIDAFDQPNVQESKDNTKRLLAQFAEMGTLAKQPQIASAQELSLFADPENASAISASANSFEGIFEAHLSRVHKGDYVALTQYIAETRAHDELVEQLRVAIREYTGAAVTTGYGPRFLHSTGQLHKGGPDSGVFIQLTAPDQQDVSIPGELYTFGVLKEAQALGDFESLTRHRRRAIRVDLGSNIEQGLQLLFNIVNTLHERKSALARKVA